VIVTTPWVTEGGHPYKGINMIELTKLNKKKFILNSDLIETVESTPDTIITLQTGKLLLVLEPPGEVIERIIDFRRKLQILPED